MAAESAAAASRNAQNEQLQKTLVRVMETVTERITAAEGALGGVSADTEKLKTDMSALLEKEGSGSADPGAAARARVAEQMAAEAAVAAAAAAEERLRALFEARAAEAEERARRAEEAANRAARAAEELRAAVDELRRRGAEAEQGSDARVAEVAAACKMLAADVSALQRGTAAAAAAGQHGAAPAEPGASPAKIANLEVRAVRAGAGGRIHIHAPPACERKPPDASTSCNHH